MKIGINKHGDKSVQVSLNKIINDCIPGGTASVRLNACASSDDCSGLSYDWSNEMSYTDKLIVGIKSNELYEWGSKNQYN